MVRPVFSVTVCDRPDLSSVQLGLPALCLCFCPRMMVLSLPPSVGPSVHDDDDGPAGPEAA